MRSFSWGHCHPSLLQLDMFRLTVLQLYLWQFIAACPCPKYICSGRGENIVMQHFKELFVSELTMKIPLLWYCVYPFPCACILTQLSMRIHRLILKHLQPQLRLNFYKICTIPHQAKCTQRLAIPLTCLQLTGSIVRNSCTLGLSPCGPPAWLLFFSQKMSKACSLHFQDFTPYVWNIEISLNYYDRFNICLLKIQPRTNVKTQ